MTQAYASPVRQTLGALAVSAIVLAAAPGSASAQALDLAFVAQEERVTAQLEALPEHSLKSHYLYCAREATRQALGFGQAALCSIVYETLLRRAFGGNFDALLAWSRNQRDDAGNEVFKEAVAVENAQALRR